MCSKFFKFNNFRVNSMYEISDKLYANVAEELVVAIGAKEFFSGSVVAMDDEVECRLVTTLIVSHDEDCRSITSIVPVWWECHTTIGGCEVCNDFSFSSVIDYLIS